MEREAGLTGSRRGAASLWRIVPALGIAQIIAWGSLYYSLAVLGPPMRVELGIGEPMLFGAFTMSLLLSGLAAPIAGKLIDGRGGRMVLSAGSALAALALGVIATATSAAVFVIGWAIAGIAMAACLYDAAFSTLNQIAGASYRRALTALTLVAGFASTIFWPLSHVLLEVVGWRQTLALYAGLQLLVCLPIHVWLVPAHRPRRTLDGSSRAPEAPHAPTGMSYRWLAAAFALAAFIFSVLSVHLISLLQTAGLSATDAIVVGALIGPMQVAGRVVEFVFARNVRATAVGAVSLAIMLVALVLLWFVHSLSPVAFAFAVLYGSSNGIITIVRGTVPAELFGRDGYGELLGRLARPVFIAQAIAPAAFAVALSSGLSPGGGVLGLAGCAAAALVAYWFATGDARRQAMLRV
jgi:predicted MFS family arabinose efflux permease